MCVYVLNTSGRKVKDLGGVSLTGNEREKERQRERRRKTDYIAGSLTI